MPEEGGRDPIPQDPPAPGTVYTAAVDGDERRAGLYRSRLRSLAERASLSRPVGMD